jgi:cell division protein FtsL
MIHRGLLFWSIAAVATAIGLFTVKYKVQDLEEKIDRTNQKIIESQQATHILRVEWAHLNEAERIERLALKYLKVEPATIKQVVRLDSLTTASAKTADSQPPRRDPPLPSPPRTGNDVPSSILPGGGRVAAEAGSPSPASAPPPGRSAGPSTPPRPANQEPATAGPVGEGKSAAVSIDDILSRNEGERR